jgi:hypothetical protein
MAKLWKHRLRSILPLAPSFFFVRQSISLFIPLFGKDRKRRSLLVALLLRCCRSMLDFSVVVTAKFRSRENSEDISLLIRRKKNITNANSFLMYASIVYMKYYA